MMAFGSPLLAFHELRRPKRTGGAALVFIGHRIGHLGILQRLAQRAPGGVPAAAGLAGIIILILVEARADSGRPAVAGRAVLI